MSLSSRVSLILISTTIVLLSACRSVSTSDEGIATVMPVPSASIPGNKGVPDGIYNVSFDLDSISVGPDSVITVPICFYSHDLYDATDIEALQPGDSIYIDGSTIAVDSISATCTSNRIFVDINGDIETGGYILTRDNDGHYRTLVFDDFPIYYEIAWRGMVLAPEAIFTDSFDIDNPDVKSGVSGLIDNPNNYFIPNNTTAEIKDNRIIAVNRQWVP